MSHRMERHSPMNPCDLRRSERRSPVVDLLWPGPCIPGPCPLKHQSNHECIFARYFVEPLVATGLPTVPGVEVDTTAPATNMVYFNLQPQARLQPLELTSRLREQGIVLDCEGGRRFRLVTHYWVSGADVETVTGAFREALGA